MRDTLLRVVASGVFDHTIAAFWQYIIYMEILLKIREMVLPKSRNDFALQERIRLVESEFPLNEAMVSGDFTSRLEAAVQAVIRVAEGAKDTDGAADFINPSSGKSAKPRSPSLVRFGLLPCCEQDTASIIFRE
jgi:hypothetical protein